MLDQLIKILNSIRKPPPGLTVIIYHRRSVGGIIIIIDTVGKFITGHDTITLNVWTDCVVCNQNPRIAPG